MKTWMLIGAGAGAALLGYGLLRGVPEIKALKPLGAAPETPGVLPRHDPGVIPTHTQKPDAEERANATFCQLLTAYRQDLRLHKTRQDSAKSRMQEALREAEQVCDEFAWNATWRYRYEGLFGANGWTEFSKTRSRALKTSCVEYVKGISDDPGKPSIPNPPRSGAYWYDGSYLKVAEQIRALKQQVEDARSALPALRDKYARAKADYDRAGAKVAELEKKIRDLEAQGVFC